MLFAGLHKIDAHYYAQLVCILLLWLGMASTVLFVDVSESIIGCAVFIFVQMLCVLFYLQKLVHWKPPLVHARREH